MNTIKSQNESAAAAADYRPTTSSKVFKKEFRYSKTGVKIGNGKFGPVSLIVHQNKLYALKIIPKTSIDSGKRIEHVKNEK